MAAANAKGVRAGRAYVEAGWQGSALDKGLRAAEKKLKSFGASLTSIGASMAGAGAAITAPLFLAVKSFADAGSELWDMAGRTGVSVEALSALGHAAAQTGAEMSDVERGIRFMQKTLTAAAKGGQEAQAAFAMLGLDFRKIRQLSPDEQFAAVARAVASIADPTAKAAAAMMMFGKNNTALIPMIDDLDALTQEAQDFGLVMSTEAAQAADELGDAMMLLSRSVMSLVKAVGGALAPAWTAWYRSMSGVVGAVKAFVNANKPLVVMAYNVGLGLTIAGTAVVGLGLAFTVLGSALGGIGAAIGVVIGVIGAMLSPIGLVIAALVAGGVAFFKYTAAGKTALAGLGGQFTTLKADAISAFKGIAAAMSAGDLQLAAQILWQALKVEWLKGTMFLKSTWFDWTKTARQNFSTLTFAMAKMMTNAWFALRSIWASMSSDLTGTWGTMIERMIRMFVPLTGPILDFFGVDLAGSIDTALASLGVETGDRAKQDAALKQQLADIEAQRVATLGVLQAEQALDKERRDNAMMASLAMDLGALEDAKSALEVLQVEAARKAGENAALNGNRPPMFGDTNEADLADGIDQAARKIDVQGSFNAAALRGLGAGDSVANDQLKEQKKSNDQLEKLNRKADNGRLVFAS
jgi:hypothetical protein